MEIKFDNVSLKYKNKYLIKDMNLVIKEEITGIYGDNYSIIARLLLSNSENSGNILIDGKEKKSYFKNNVGYVSSHYEFLTETVSDEFYLAKKDINDSSKKYLDKIVASLKMVGLEKDYLERKNYTLSKSEKKLVQIALSLISNPDVIIFENVFTYLDGKNKLRIKKIIEELNKDYHKNIVIVDNDINILYELASKIVIIDQDRIIINGSTNDVFKDKELFKKHNIELPKILEFINSHQDLSYTNDLKQLIKEVSKNVSKVCK